MDCICSIGWHIFLVGKAACWNH